MMRSEAERELPRADAAPRQRVEQDIADLRTRLAGQQALVADVDGIVYLSPAGQHP